MTMASHTQHRTSSVASARAAGLVALLLAAAAAASPATTATRDNRQFHQYHAQTSFIPRQVQQQWLMAMNVPPAALLKQEAEAALPPAAPGHMWVQVPITEQPPHPDAVGAASEAPAGATTTEATEAPLAPEAATHAPADPEMLKHCLEPRGQFAHPDDCAKFFNCWDGVVAEQACPNDLVFSDQGPFCDYAHNVDCSARGGAPPAHTEPPAQSGSSESLPESTDSPAGPSGPEAEAPQEGVDDQEGQQVSEEQMKEDVGEGCKESYSRYRSPKHCNVFVVCDNHVPYRFECPDTLNYNENLGVCDYPYRVDCGNSTSAYPTEAPVASSEAPPQSEAEQAAAQEEIYRRYFQQQFRLPAATSAYYGGFAHLPPVKIVPGFVRRN